MTGRIGLLCQCAPLWPDPSLLVSSPPPGSSQRTPLSHPQSNPTAQWWCQGLTRLGTGWASTPIRGSTWLVWPPGPSVLMTVVAASIVSRRGAQGCLRVFSAGLCQRSPSNLKWIQDFISQKWGFLYGKKGFWYENKKSHCCLVYFCSYHVITVAHEVFSVTKAVIGWGRGSGWGGKALLSTTQLCVCSGPSCGRLSCHDSPGSSEEEAVCTSKSLIITSPSA